MRPDQMAEALRQIATKIDNSKAPKRKLIARDLKRIIVGTNLEQFCLHGTDGPVTPFVALVRAFEAVGQGKANAEEAANFIAELDMFKNINWESEEIPSSEY